MKKVSSSSPYAETPSISPSAEIVTLMYRSTLVFAVHQAYSIGPVAAPTVDAYTRAHLNESRVRVERALSAGLELSN